jgi:hypothetical protein
MQPANRKNNKVAPPCDKPADTERETMLWTVRYYESLPVGGGDNLSAGWHSDPK